MTNDAIRDLIERVERAPEGSRELDVLIARLVGRIPVHAGFVDADDVAWDKGLGFSVPRYSASLDDAMSLAPKGRRLTVQQRRSYEPFWVSFMVDGGAEYDATGRAKTLALTICAASLRAHIGTGV